jgi:hypothetical protein
MKRRIHSVHLLPSWLPVLTVESELSLLLSTQIQTEGESTASQALRLVVTVS